MESKEDNVKVIEIKGRMVVTRGRGLGKTGDPIRGYKPSGLRIISSRDLTHSTVTIVNSAVLDT